LSGFSVNPDELHGVSSLIYDVADELAGSSTLGYTVDPSNVGHTELADAIGQFHVASEQATKALLHDTQESAIRLAGIAQAYEAAEEIVSEVAAARLSEQPTVRPDL
jgi:hypothetical protein